MLASVNLSMSRRVAVKYARIYRDLVSTKSTRYLFPCIDVGVMGPQESEEIDRATSYRWVVGWYVLGLLLPSAHP